MKVIVPNYDEKSDDELLRLTLESDSLTPEAGDALRIELKKRSLDSPTRLAKFLGTYRFSRDQGSKRFRVLDKKALDWGQVAWLWTKALAIIAVVLFVMDTVPSAAK